VIRRPGYAMAMMLTACGGGAAVDPVRPVGSAAGAVRGFLEAVADSNLAKMASLWGTARGPASQTRQPPDYERRIAVMQAYLQHDDSRIAADTPSGEGNRHEIQVELRRQACTVTVPFVAIRATDGNWLVNQVDLTAAGNPSRPCQPGQRDSTTSQ